MFWFILACTTLTSDTGGGDSIALGGQSGSEHAPDCGDGQFIFPNNDESEGPDEDIADFIEQVDGVWGGDLKLDSGDESVQITITTDPNSAQIFEPVEDDCASFTQLDAQFVFNSDSALDETSTGVLRFEENGDPRLLVEIPGASIQGELTPPEPDAVLQISASLEGNGWDGELVWVNDDNGDVVGAFTAIRED
ncbi:MAG: hypothetical protein AAFV53_04580 [Myxococcota bacterium]